MTTTSDNTVRWTFARLAQAAMLTGALGASQVAGAFTGQDVEIVHSHGGTDACLDVKWGQAKNGQDVWSYACNGTNAQKWRLVARGGDAVGAYKVVSRLGNYCLDNRGDFSDGGRMGIWSCVGDTHGAVRNQSVYFKALAGGEYNLVFRKSDGTEVAVWAYRAGGDKNGNVGQRTSGHFADTRARWSVHGEDTEPTFGGATVANQIWTENTAITALVLPAATEGDGTLSYALSPSLPSGLSLDTATRTISGTPTAAVTKLNLSWTATDSDGDTATVSFAIEIKEEVLPSFGTQTVADQVWTENTAITALVLPAATKGSGTLSYSLSPSLPSGLSLDTATRTISGTPTGPTGKLDMSWTVTDPNGNTATVSFDVEVKEDIAPSFGSATVADQVWLEDAAITAVVLPDASGGNGALVFGLDPALPAGLSFDVATRTISGTPTTASAETIMDWTVTR